MGKSDYITDPSFAKISIHKINQHPHSLFGSHRKHGRTIEISIAHGSMTRKDNTMVTGREKEIIKLEMSFLQFAELFSSVGEYSGADATITFTEQDGLIKAPEMPNIDAVQKADMRKRLSGLTKQISNFRQMVEELQSGKSLSATKKNELLEAVKITEMEVSRGLPFIMNMFSEEIDRVVQDATMEAQAILEEKFQSGGADKIAGQLQSLLGEAIVDELEAEEEAGEQ